MLEKILKSKAEVNILGIVLFSEGLHLREIARRAEISSYEAKRELDNLIQLGVLRKEKKGNLVLFYSNPECPFLFELRNLYLKTEGIFAILKEKLPKNLKYALIYGSMAKGDFNEKSDVDLLLIGDINEQKIESKILEIQKKVGREINYILWTEQELKQKIKRKGGFIKSILKNPIIMIIGDKNEFIRT